MSTLTSLNSTSLQEAFPVVYQKFFAEHDLVVSSAVAYSMNPAASWMAGGLSIYQKLPFKGYLGIRKSGARKSVALGSVLVYDANQNVFIEDDEDLNYWKGGLEYLAQYVDGLTGSREAPGWIFDLLLEQPENIGFETSLGTMLMAGATLWYGTLTPEDAEKFVSLSGKDLIARKTPESQKYAAFHGESMTLLRRLSCGRMVSGATVYKSVMESATPLIYWTEERGGSDTKPHRNLFPLEISSKLELFDKMQWGGARLDDVLNVSGKFPLDVVSIFPGVRSGDHVNVLEQESQGIFQKFEDLQKFSRMFFGEILKDQDVSRHPPFLKEMQEDGQYWQAYASGQTLPGIALLRSLVELYQHKVSAAAIRNFCEAMNAMNTINYPFEEGVSKIIRTIAQEIWKRADAADVTIGVRMLSVGKQDRSILIFSEKGKFRAQIYAIVEYLQKECNKNIDINFASWRDGWGKDGLRVEQFISQGIYSKFIELDAMRLVQWSRKGEVRTSIVKHDSVKGAGRDILIDMVHEKIQVAGKECTSRELPSQKATVVIMDALLTAEGHRLHNRALPESGYTKYRNELQGKITGPLVALVKKRLKKDFDLKVEGTLIDFWVSLDPKGFDIGVVKKMG